MFISKYVLDSKKNFWNIFLVSFKIVIISKLIFNFKNDIYNILEVKTLHNSEKVL